MTKVSGFSGFSQEAVDFLVNLRDNNNKMWFEENKPEYEKYVVDPARLMITQLGGMLQQIVPNLIFDPRTDKSLFRIYRDTRFSKDKTPFKTHVGIFMWEGGKKMESPGFYFHLEPPLVMLSSGLYMFTPDQLKKYRNAVANDKSGTKLVSALREIQTKADYVLGGSHYKRVPAGFAPDHERAGLLLHKGIYVNAELPLIKELYSADLIPVCYDVFKNMLPLHKWIVENIL